jgi:muconate cycloisomerase
MNFIPSSNLTEEAIELQRSLAIREIKARIVDVPTIRAHKLSNTEVAQQGYVLVKLTLENGAVGYGEASTLGGPRWAEESVETIKAVIDAYLAPSLLGRNASLFEANAGILAKAAKRNFAAKCALDAAALDAVGKTLNTPATTLLGGAVRQSFPAIWALASGDVDQEIDEGRAHLDASRFNRFKVKLGFHSPVRDMERLRKLRDGLGPDVDLIVDVNQGWSEADCIRHLPAMEELDIALIEQPLPADQLPAMARISRCLDIPVMLDEAIFTAEDAALAGQLGAGSVLSLKLLKCGSAHALKRVASVASAFGQELYGGCLLESSVGAAAHLSVFATLPELQWGTEHFGPLILKRDLVQRSLTYENFEVSLSQGPGLGIEIDQDAVDEFARKEVS